MIEIKDKYKVERGVKIKRSQLSNNDYNPNKTTERQQEAIAESLGAYGQLTSVLVRPDPDNDGSYIIIDGEHRSKVLTEEVYVDIVYDLTENDAKKLTIIMNETRGMADKIELSQLLNQLNTDFDIEDLKIGLPYDTEELNDLISLANVNWDDYENNLEPESDDNNPEEEEDWTTLTARVPNEVLDVINQVIALVREEKDLHQDKAIALGQVLECLAAEYLALPAMK